MRFICPLSLFLLSAFLGLAEEIPYTKVGPWSIIAITNADGTLNRCTAHLPGAQGALRIAVSPNMKSWALSIPGNTPSMKLKPGQVWGETFWEYPTGHSGLGRLFDHGGSNRASTKLNLEEVKELRTATSVSVKLSDRKDPCERCPAINYVWQPKEIGKALAALPACIKAN